jgi:hypothetical protein
MLPISHRPCDAHADSLETLDLLLLLDSGVTELGSGPGNKDLVSGEVTGSSVVLAVRDPPRMVRDEEDRVENPSNKVVDPLAGRVALVTTLVAESQLLPCREPIEETHAMIQRPVPKRPVTKV